MTIKFRKLQLFMGICLAAFAGTGQAYENSLDLSLPSTSFYTQNMRSFLLAANESDDAKYKTTTESVSPAADFKPPLFSAGKVHQYLGIGTVVLAGLTALSHPEEECEGASCPANQPRELNGSHARLAKATVAMAAATIATGLYAHWDDFNLADGLADPDNLHVMLAVTGAALMAYAVNLSANSAVPVNHAAIAEAGALSMVVAIKLNW